MRTIQAESRSAAESGEAISRAQYVVRSLEQIDAPSDDVFRTAYVQPRRPIVLKGQVADWPAVRRWSLDHLARTFATALVNTAHLDAGQVAVNDETGLIYEPMRFGQFVAALQRGARDRYLMSRLADLPDAIRDDAPPPSYLADAGWQDAKLWISTAGTVSYTHRDLADNVHAQVFGRKRFTLIAPEQSTLLSPKNLFDSIPNGCHVDIERPDFARYPRLRELETFVAELEPGDAIYIPRRWWHHVRTLETSISVNFWWASGSRRMLVLAGDYFKRVRGLHR